MLRAYETPELTIHGSIAMLTRDEGGEEGKGTCSKDPSEHEGGGDSKPDKPDYDAFCLFSHSPGAES